MAIKIKLKFVFESKTFQKQCHEERTWALKSQVSALIRNHKKSFSSIICHVHANKEISHYIIRDETIRISEHCRQYIHTPLLQVMAQHKEGSAEAWHVSSRPENTTVLQNILLGRMV